MSPFPPVNPYEPPSSVPAGKHPESWISVPVLIRLTIGFATSFITCWWFCDHVVPVLTAPLWSLGIMILVAVLLGLMPAGYGKWDGLFGIWLMALAFCFSFSAWRVYSPSVAPLERTPALIGCILGYGGIFGGLCVFVYGLARIFSRRIFSSR